MLIASIDPVTKAVDLLSFPRDISNFKLWDGRTFTGKLNSLMTYARLHPKEFPDGGVNTLTKELGYLSASRILLLRGDQPRRVQADGRPGRWR